MTGRVEVIHRATKNAADHVWNVIALKGNTLTFREVQSLMGGVTVGGHTTADLHHAENTAAAHTFLIERLLDDDPREPVRSVFGRFNAIFTRSAFGTIWRLRTHPVHPEFGADGIDGSPSRARHGTEYRAGLDALEHIERPGERSLAYFTFAAHGRLYPKANPPDRHECDGPAADDHRTSLDHRPHSSPA
ncbi:hypothetical protein [Rhodococcus sp. ARC_M6]|uniref:hypothetical protein n=1 Tax=Rhodococcus sp. ARC_M6 TaxID=2928852 RepID=UPI001FB27BC5|nr:hypothetical protein [Rhodococcus sp. ARC_M6]MCJ0907073.1 hypothetical protein [Rhodococcus sp. ARC_M6]